MKKSILLILFVGLLLPNLFSAVNYLSEEEYKELSKAERLRYWESLEQERDNNLQRKEDANAKQEKTQQEIDAMKAELKTVNDEFTVVRTRIMNSINVSDSNLAMVENKINHFNNKINNWNNLSDDELWSSKKDIQDFINEYNEFKDTKYAKIPDFQDQYDEIDRKIKGLERNLEAAKPKYFEDDYTVRNGDTLSKISGYEHIYNDPTKWGIIYRANRDQIKDPNIVSVDQVIKIPRGLPYTWKVYKGEFLWKIASYPEVYGDGTKWTKIYEANRDKIKDKDLIFPNQEFEIPRD